METKYYVYNRGQYLNLCDYHESDYDLSWDKDVTKVTDFSYIACLNTVNTLKLLSKEKFEDARVKTFEVSETLFTGQNKELEAITYSNKMERDGYEVTHRSGQRLGTTVVIVYKEIINDNSNNQ
jgi:hypothetical protein